MRGKQGEEDRQSLEFFLLLEKHLGDSWRRRALCPESRVAGMKPECCYPFCAQMWY